MHLKITQTLFLCPRHSKRKNLFASGRDKETTEKIIKCRILKSGISERKKNNLRVVTYGTFPFSCLSDLPWWEMGAKQDQHLDELIQYVTLHKLNPLAFQATLSPFLFAIACLLYIWVFVYGFEEFYEAGLVSLAAIGCLEVLLCLCCYWSVHINTFLNCRRVSRIYMKMS